MALPEVTPAALAPAAGLHGKKPATVRPEPVTLKTLFNGTSASQGEQEIKELTAKASALRINDLPTDKNAGVSVKVKAGVAVPADQDRGKAKEQDAEDDGGYLSDDPDECQDPVTLNEIAVQARVAITLLVPFAWRKEIPRIINTVNHLLTVWGKHMSENVKATTRCQQLTATFLSKQHFGRIEVVFLLEADAGFMRSREIEHYTTNDKKLTLGWQHPENKEYLKEREAHPEAIEVLLKGVPAVISPAMIKHNLVSAMLLKRGRTAFRDGSAFHRVLDPVSGSDTDKIKGLVFRHQGDKYKWWLQLRASMLTSVHPFPRAAASMKLSSALKILQADPAMALTSTGGVREEWLCSQEDCGKAHGSSFESAVEHVQSVRHGTGQLKAKAATRLSKGKLNLAQVKKEYGMRGVRKLIESVTESLDKAGRGSLENLLPRLTAGLRAYEKEERKRVTATQLHLTEEVERLRHMVMGGPTDDKVKAQLLTMEEQLESYREDERERLEVFAGLTAEMQGEIPSPYLSAQVKMRKERTLIEEVLFQGRPHRRPFSGPVVARPSAGPVARPFSGPTAALSAAPSPAFQQAPSPALSAGPVAALPAARRPPFQRPHRRPSSGPSPTLSAAPSPPFRGPVAASVGPVAAASGPVAATCGPDPAPAMPRRQPRHTGGTCTAPPPPLFPVTRRGSFRGRGDLERGGKRRPLCRLLWRPGRPGR
ncbi:unnamed protein product [Closterium sp. NIES-65]|nr:unnamed protein product [Closterium sp. NIES-65]